MSGSSISTERKGYGRGLILGLTMAETFLLLVFCLLLIAAAAISTERQKAAQAIASLAASRVELEKLQIEAITLRESSKLLVKQNDKLEHILAGLPKEVIENSSIDEDWSELKFARDMVKNLAKSGVTAEEALSMAPALKVLKDSEFLNADLSKLNEQLAELIQQAKISKANKPHEWPPIINLSEAGGYYFAVGSAELSTNFRQKLGSEIGGQIAEYLKKYDVDVIEVIGHTDEQPLSGISSNFDKMVEDVLSGAVQVTAVHAADNAGLGIARAMAVAEILRRDPRLADATVLPLSAAQLILPGDKLTDGRHAGDVEARRRIEIRIRRRSLQVGSSETSTPP
jgi:flagellar motor protein MotB